MKLRELWLIELRRWIRCRLRGHVWLDVPDPTEPGFGEGGRQRRRKCCRCYRVERLDAYLRDLNPGRQLRTRWVRVYEFEE